MHAAVLGLLAARLVIAALQAVVHASAEAVPEVQQVPPVSYVPLSAAAEPAETASVHARYFTQSAEGAGLQAERARTANAATKRKEFFTGT